MGCYHMKRWLYGIIHAIPFYQLKQISLDSLFHIIFNMLLSIYIWCTIVEMKYKIKNTIENKKIESKHALMVHITSYKRRLSGVHFCRMHFWPVPLKGSIELPWIIMMCQPILLQFFIRKKKKKTKKEIVLLWLFFSNKNQTGEVCIIIWKLFHKLQYPQTPSHPITLHHLHYPTPTPHPLFSVL